MKKLILALAFPIILLSVWQLASAINLLSPAYFPAPSRTAEALFESVASGRLWRPLAATLTRMFEGWVLASVAGVVLGALIGSSAFARKLLRPSLEFLRPLPASAIIPAAILIFGLSNSMAIFVIAFGSVWPVLLETLHGFASVETRLKEVSRALEMRPFEFLSKIALPSALPDIFNGVRVSLAIAFILAVVVEMQAAQPGLGQNILLAQRMFRSPELYAGILVLGLCGYLTNKSLTLLEKKLMHWRVKT